MNAAIQSIAYIKSASDFDEVASFNILSHSGIGSSIAVAAVAAAAAA